MRFFATGSTPEGHLVGHATNSRQDPSRQFCDAYRHMANRILDPADMALEPVFWGGEAPPEEAADLRFPYSIEEEPGLFKGVFECLGHEPAEIDFVVVMRDGMLEAPLDDLTMYGVVVQDAASLLTDQAGFGDDLGWAGPDVLRAAIAATIVRSTEHVLPAHQIDDVYQEICAGAVEGLVNSRYARVNGEVIFVHQNPGLVTLIDLVVANVRAAAPVERKGDAFIDAAVRTVEAAVAEMGSGLGIAA